MNARFIILSLTFFLISFCGLPVSVLALDGVESIIINDHSTDVEMGQTHTLIGPSQGFGSQGTADSNDNYEFNDNFDAGQFLNIDLSIDKMKSAVAAQVGPPDANALVLILFSLAALLQIARVTAGQGNWIAFIVRVIVVLACLRGFNSLFAGVGTFASYLSSQLLNGQTAYDTLWSSQNAILDKMDFFSAEGLWGKIKSMFSQDGIYYMFVIASFIFVYAIYVLIYLVQACILIALQYFGPIIIALAIIPETDFSSGYIASVLKVLFWTVITSLLIKIMSTIIHINLFAEFSYPEFISMTAMNICFALAFLFVPAIAEMVFSGKGWSALGSAMTGFGGGIMGMAAGFIGSNLAKPPRALAGFAWDKTKDLGNRGLHKAGNVVKSGAHKSIGALKSLTPAGRREASKERYPNSGYGNSSSGGSAYTISKEFNKTKNQNHPS